MFFKRVFCFVAGTLLASVPAIVSAYGGSIPDIRQKGWFHPVEYRSHEDCAQFGGPPAGYPGHIGDDLCRPEGTGVFAIADGCVEGYKTDASDYGGIGMPGGAILLRHKTAFGRVFYANYGHNTPNSSYLNERKCSGGSKSVVKGDRIATIHRYFGEGGKRMDHLHFGIRPDAVDPDSMYHGAGCHSSDNCGWTEPFSFLSVNEPAP